MENSTPFTVVLAEAHVTCCRDTNANRDAAAAATAKSLQSYPALCDPIDGRLPRPWDSPGKNTGVGCHFLLQCMKDN